MNRKQSLLGLIFAVIGIFGIGVLAVYADSYPTPTASWLTTKGTGSHDEALEYYTAINATNDATTLSAWQSTYGFDGSEQSEVHYSKDLGFGRKTSCRQQGDAIACFVDYHDKGDDSLADTIASANKLFTTALVWNSANATSGEQQVKFYAYDSSGNLTTTLPFDSGETKYVPNVCTACHGGDYDDYGNILYDGWMIPFNPAHMTFPDQPGYTLSDQQEVIRSLNSLVNSTNLNSRAADLITGSYAASGGVGQAGSTFDESYVPAAWSGVPTATLYSAVYAPYCSTCHLQVGSLRTPEHLVYADYAVFADFYMPHAEQIFKDFWDSTAPAQLAEFQGSSYSVTRTDDPEPDGCQVDDCSLREAIIAANAASDADYLIITFANDAATYTLSRSGSDDDAQHGDLDLTNTTKTLLILGKGSANTIIDGNSIDRIIDIQPGVTTRIQGVTLQHGVTTNNGGAIRNQGTLALRSATVISNTATEAGGALFNFSTATIDAVTFAGNTTMDGTLANRATLTVTQSLFSANQASRGGGIYNEGSGTAIVQNSTFSGGYSANSIAEGQAIHNRGVLTLTNSTIADNTGAFVAGLFNWHGTLHLYNNLIADNAGWRECLNDGGAIMNNTNNWIEDGSCSATYSGDPKLAALGDNGGETQTFALLSGSLAVEAGDNATCLTTDQRGVVRPNGDSCDIGAYEYENNPPTAQDDTVNVTEDSIGNTVDVLGNDSVLPDDGESLSLSSVGLPSAGGSVSISSGTLRYTPTANFNGSQLPKAKALGLVPNGHLMPMVETIG